MTTEHETAREYAEKLVRDFNPRGPNYTRHENVQLAREFIGLLEQYEHEKARADDLEQRMDEEIVAHGRTEEQLEDAARSRMVVYRESQVRIKELEEQLETQQRALVRIRDWDGFRHTGEVRDCAAAALSKGAE